MSQSSFETQEQSDYRLGHDHAEQSALREDVRLLGGILGETIEDQHGKALYTLIEEVREIAKNSRTTASRSTSELISKLSQLPSEKLLLLARSFTLFLNLANIAEQQHQIRQRRQSWAKERGLGNIDASAAGGFLALELNKIAASGTTPDELHRQICKLSINLVLTAHPTEVSRRAVSSKFLRISRLLSEQDRHDLSSSERFEIIQSLKRAIMEVWKTDEIRRLRPTPVDEAKSGLTTIEHSLWHVIPTVLRNLNQVSKNLTGKALPSTPLRSHLVHGWGVTAMETPMSRPW